jgi:hypothetical protein
LKWFDKNPWGPNPSLRQEFAWGAHQFGRNQFASSFARRGFAATAFALTPGQAFKTGMGSSHKFGSAGHISNLKTMVAKDPTNPNYINALKKAQIGAGKTSGLLKKAKGLGLGAAFFALPAFTTPGGIEEKVRSAVTSGIGGGLGWHVGGKLGMSSGAAIGTAILPGIGSAIGAAAGYIAGAFGGAMAAESASDYVSRLPDKLVERERSKRNLNWVHDQSAFLTKNAYTMRQQSLAAMNRGMMTTRSIMGREGAVLHQ